MSTRSFIALKLREEDKRRVLKSSCGKVVSTSYDYLYVYCHFDGYPDGVGADLVDLKMTYDDALDFILEGDRSSVSRSYWGWRGEECPPKSTSNPVDLDARYVYILEDIENREPVKISCYDKVCKTTIVLYE